MSDGDLAQLPIPANLMEAIQRAKKITKRGGLRRELLFIAKVLRSFDTESLYQAIELQNAPAQEANAQFHVLEQWREKLIESPEALTEFISEYPNADIQGLRQQLRLHKTAKKPAQKTKAFRLIFQLIKQAVED
jgi:ribosome-associated protein